VTHAIGEAGAGVEASRGGGDSRNQHAKASRSRAEEASRSGVESSRGGGDSRDQHAEASRSRTEEASRSRTEEASRSGEAGAGVRRGEQGRRRLTRSAC
jgi:hypothetical protein